MTRRLKRERLARGMTLRELGEAVQCSHAAISYLEHGQSSEPRPGLRARLEQFMKLPIATLMIDESETDAPVKGRPSLSATTTGHAKAPEPIQGGVRCNAV